MGVGDQCGRERLTGQRPEELDQVFLFLGGDVLFEHQSTVDSLMSFRLLRYEIRIRERWLRDNPGAHRLPAILPVVLHHSVDGWTGSTSFEDLLDGRPPRRLVGSGA